MKKKFAVAVNGGSSEEHEAFRVFLTAREGIGTGWWHWLTDFWLIVDLSGTWNAAELRSIVRQFYPGKFLMVIETGAGEWAGFGPTAPTRDMFEWLRKNWD